MSSSAFDATLSFDVGPSRALCALVGAAYALAAAGSCAALAPMPAALAVGGAALLGARDLCRLRRRHRLYWGRDGRFRRDDFGAPAMVVDPATWSSPWLIVLVLRGPAGRIDIPIARDAVTPGTWRRLRARLRVAGSAAAGEGA